MGGLELEGEGQISGSRRMDDTQLAFINAAERDIRLLAPAGSGKTMSLLYRCAELHRRSGGNASFLIVSFTRAARDELRARLTDDAFAGFAARADVVTLNGWGHRRLKAMHAQPRLHVSDFERATMLKSILAPAWSTIPALETGMKRQPFKLPQLLAGLLDMMKTLGFDHEDGSLGMADDRLEMLEQLGLLPLLEDFMLRLHQLDVLANRRWEPFLEVALPFFNAACTQQFATGSFTLEDQKYAAWLDQRRQSAAGAPSSGADRITDILVDEFQDINPLDLALILQIAQLNQSALTIVGDDDQAIFEWRGAAPDFILEPDRHLGRRFATYVLEKNYRCPRNIVQKSARLIRHNIRRVDKAMHPVSTVDAEIAIYPGATFLESVQNVLAEIRHFVERKTPGARMALLSRKRAQLIPYQILLAREDIPFCAAEDLHLFLSDTFDRLLGALRTRTMAGLGVAVPTIVDDVMALCHSVQRFPLRKVEADAMARHIRSARPKSYDAAIDRLETYDGTIRGQVDEGATAADFAIKLRRLIHAPSVRAAIEALQTLYSGFKKDYGRGVEDIFLADPPFAYLAEFSESYGEDFHGFVDDLEKAKDTLVKLPGMDADDSADALWKKPVHLMTALRAKGREFDTVAMLDVVDGIWPLRTAKSERAIEGERRLFYVAMTRAKKRLILTSSHRIGDQVTIPSPFLAEAALP
ncbi:DNA helicase-2/ATP-dependent DNA helicase PcrA [Angulomicrobium tetraedrale]|uniref:DNA 3'-5' helicase n=1 Tax=Ancylobacter tetraedralis TaxID=217068 RepID=A0A839ZB87_9HYPH|nr:ATP-dependent helicase [Ancylobacter tetraedralis]MBB3771995.1 DNA helicase-2/ATP-dependent DNA helicase PcrA [Ancylobacter tetraedralis]